MEYNYQVWRQQRNENTLNEITMSSKDADQCPWDRPVVNLPVGAVALNMVFHAYDHHLVVTNETDMIRCTLSYYLNQAYLTSCSIYSVWNWYGKARLLNRFCNGNPRGTSITSLHLINQEVGGIIMTGSGMLRILLYYLL